MAFGLSLDSTGSALDANNGSDYILGPFDPGPVTANREIVASYTNTYRVVNRTKGEAVMTAQILVQGTSLSDCKANLDALAAKMELTDFVVAYNDGSNAFTYSVTDCEPLYYNPGGDPSAMTDGYLLKFWTIVTCIMYRRP